MSFGSWRAVCQLCIKRRLPKDESNVDQIIGREGETAAFLSRCLLSLNLCGGGFAPRQLRRWAEQIRVFSV